MSSTCPYCQKKTKDFGICCDTCNHWYHYDCLNGHSNTPGLTEEIMNRAIDPVPFDFHCPQCKPDGPSILQLFFNANLLSIQEAKDNGWDTYLNLPTLSPSDHASSRLSINTPVNESTGAQSHHSVSNSNLDLKSLLDFMREERREQREQQRLELEERRLERENQHKLFAEMVAKIGSNQQSGNCSSNAANNPGNNHQSSTDFDKFIRLPKHSLKTFSGNLVEWPEFWRSFQNHVDHHPTLSIEAKFEYLKESLKGTAAAVVHGLAGTKENYPIAIRLLQERFHQPAKIQGLHIQALNRLAPLRSDFGNVESFVSQMEIHLCQLEAQSGGLGDGSVYYSLIESKLPSDLLASFIRKMLDIGIKQPTLDNIRSHLKDEVEIQMRTRQYGYSPLVKSERSVAATTSEQPRSDQGFIKNYTGQQKYAIPNYVTCAFCGAKANHYSAACTVISDKDARIAKLREQDLCLSCLRPRKAPSHQVCRGKPCRICSAQNHHQAICPKGRNKKFNGPRDISQGICSTPDLISPNAITNSKVFMMAVRGSLSSKQRTQSMNINIFMDGGSKYSYILNNVAKKLNLVPISNSVNLSIARFGSGETIDCWTERVEFWLNTPEGQINLTALRVPEITANLIANPLDISIDIQERLGNLTPKNFSPAQPTSYTIGLLIGNDHFYDIVKSIKQLKPGLGICDTLLGPILCGRNGEINTLSDVSSVATTTFLSPVISEFSKDYIKRFWDLETLGILDDPHIADDDLAVQQFHDGIQHIKGRYYVNWPWRSISSNLPSNFTLARARLKRFHEEKLIHSKELLTKYENIFVEQLASGIIEKVPELEMKQPIGQVHYIPHHGVIKETSTTTKLRIVYDASAKTPRGTSLNQHLLRGPVLLANLLGLLLRFRTWKFVMVSDIEKAFLQVGLQPSQRDVCRFLWLKDSSEPYSEENQTIYRFCRVPFGVISSPFLLASTIQFHLLKENSSTALAIKDNIYVDNVFHGTKTEEEAIQFYKEAKILFQKASMNLREWSSNSELLNSHLPLEDKVMSSTVKILGMKWNTESDSLQILGASSICSMEHTKRNLLQSMAKVFDPLGLFTPFLISAKLLFQQMCREEMEWDSILLSQHLPLWNHAFAGIAKIQSFSFPRQLISQPLDDPILLCFTDASLRAYGACIYLKQGTEIRLLCSKSRLSPIKSPSIPRVELLGVLIGIRLLKFVKQELHLPIMASHLWSDSQIVLSWISSERQRTVFVENRLLEIRKYPAVEFHYIASEENPADFITRGVEELSSLWWEGPDWLRDPENSWEKWGLKMDDDSELRKMKNTPTIELIVEGEQVRFPFDLNPEDFSSMDRLIRITALASRFIHNCRNSMKNRIRPEKRIISNSEKKDSLTLWIRFSQQNGLPNLFAKPSILRPTELAKGLRLFVDETGLVRSRGRLANSRHSWETNNPILLPKNHRITKLIIQQAHQNQLHAGIEQTLSQLRHHYWILGGRSQIRQVVRRCLRCQKAEGHAFKLPDLPPLPAERVKQSAAFSQIGLDLVGPFYLRNNRKVYVYIFVCMATRAVHFELAKNKETVPFLEAFSRFCSRRGIPEKIFSDNASHFIASRRYLLSQTTGQMNQEKWIYPRCSSNPPHWHFIPPASPWMGGFYERLVQSLQRSLVKILGRATVDWYQLETLVVAIEGIINTRPLTYIGTDITTGRPLTPADLIAPSSRLSEMPNERIEKELKESSAEDLKEMWKRGQSHLNSFWKQWSQEYLLGLREFNLKRKQDKKAITRQPKIGEIVIVSDPATARSQWKLARIEKVCTGADNQIRSAFVKFANGQELHRPITKLFPLEAEFSLGGSVAEIEKN